jgi:hypothetical protein
MRGSRDEQLHRTRPRLPTNLNHPSSKLGITVRHSIINRQRIETSLNRAQPAQPTSSGLLISDQHPELQLGKTDNTDGQLTRNRQNIIRDQDARIEDATAH